MKIKYAASAPGRERRHAAGSRDALSRYQEAEQANRSGVWEWNLVTGEHYRSPQMLEILGLGPEQEHRLREDLSDLVHPDDLPEVHRQSHAFLAGAYPDDTYEIVFRLRHADGTYRSLLSRAVAVRDETGRARRLVGAYTDITQWRQSQEEREAYLRALSDNLPNSAIFQTLASANGERRFLYVSRSIETLFGVKVEDALRNASLLYNRIHPEDREAHQEAEELAMRHHSVFRSEVRLLGPDVQYRWHEIRSVPHVHPDGTMVWHGIVSDITERKEAEAERIHREMELRTVLDLMPQLAYVLSGDGTLSYANHRYYEYTGLPDGYQLTPEEWPRVLHSDDMPLANSLRSEVQGQTAHPQPMEHEARVRRYDGVYRWHLIRASPIIGPDGRLERWIGTMTDIEEQKAAENEANRRAAVQERVSATLQRSLLLRPAARELPGLDLWHHYEAAAHQDETLVGGDFYDTIRLSETCVALVIGDVMGKGLTAALGTADVKFTLRAFLREELDPAKALARLNAHLLARREWDDNAPLEVYPGLHSSDPSATSTSGGSNGRLGQPQQQRRSDYVLCVAAVVVDIATGDARAAVAGMEPPLHIVAPRVVSLPTGGLPLGILPDWKPDGETHLTVAPGDLLTLFTDGLTEAQRGKGESLELLGHSRLWETVADAVRPVNAETGMVAATGGTPPAKVLGQRLLKAVYDFIDRPLSDDLCMIVARRETP